MNTNHLLVPTAPRLVATVALGCSGAASPICADHLGRTFSALSEIQLPLGSEWTERAEFHGTDGLSYPVKSAVMRDRRGR